jgi:hypothetical protein
MTQRAQPSLALTVAIFALAFVVPAWPWLSGAVTVPYDAKSTFMPPVEFMARAFATGESPFWSANVFAGWPNVADPQSMLTSPLHVLLALVSSAPGFRAIDGVSFAYLFLGGLGIILYFRDRGWHMAGALVAALAFAFGGAASARLQHTGQVISLAWLPIAFWLLSRALDRSSWRYGAAAGTAAALIVLGRDQVALLEVYVLAGFVLAHWLGGDDQLARLRASLKPLIAGGIAGLIIIALPVLLTELLALRSNRPEFTFIEAGRGSLHWTHLLSLAFADLFGAMDPKVDFWGAGGFAWNERFGMADLFLAQNMGLLYSGALVPIVLIIGVSRGLLWSREIRFFTVATVLIAFYMFGWYTPVFRAMYEVLPGVKLFRRPADGTFVFGALIAVLAGYLVHRWLTDPVASRRPAVIGLAIAAFIVIFTFWLSATTVGLAPAWKPIVTGLCFIAAGFTILVLARRFSAPASMLLLATFTTADLAWNNAPHVSTGLPPVVYEALRPDTRNDTVALIRQRLAAQQPNHRDRVELIGIGYHWPNICMIHGCEHVFGHNPLRLKEFYESTKVGDTVAAPGQRPFSVLYPSYRSTFANLFGLRLIATGVPVEQIDKALKPGDLAFVARTRDAYVYENPRALPRVLLVGDWKVADFAQLTANGWPAEVDPTRTVLLEKAPRAAPLTMFEAAGTARLVRYANTEIVVEVDTPSDAMLVLNDVWHPWWRATIGGVETEILRANVLFRAVQVPLGKSTVRFTFEPLRGAWRELRDKIRGRSSNAP